MVVEYLLSAGGWRKGMRVWRCAKLLIYKIIVCIFPSDLTERQALNLSIITSIRLTDAKAAMLRQNL